MQANSVDFDILAIQKEPLLDVKCHRSEPHRRGITIQHLRLCHQFCRNHIEMWQRKRP